MLVVGRTDYIFASFIGIDEVAEDQEGEHQNYELVDPEEALVAYKIFLLMVYLFIVGLTSHAFWTAAVL